MKSLTWAKPHETQFEHQALAPLFGSDPIEMSSKGHEETVILFLSRDPIYPDLFKAAFPEKATIDFDQIVYARWLYKDVRRSVSTL